MLAQNDTGVGVKNGLNAYGKKNFLGTFAPPHAVIVDTSFLRTLPDREWRAGASEAVKVALLKDPSFFAFLHDAAPQLVARNLEAISTLVRHWAELHIAHIATGRDPFELGSARPLDFGHWSAHKLEHLSGWRLRHGEAVAVGIALDTTYAHLARLLAEDEWLRVLALLDALGLPACGNELHHPDLGEGLHESREHLGGELTVTLVTGVAQCIHVHDMDTGLIARSVERLVGRESARPDGRRKRGLPAVCAGPGGTL